MNVTRWWPWLVAVGGVGVLVIVIAAVFLTDPGGVPTLTGVLALLPVAGGMLVWAARAARPRSAPSAADLERAADALAVAAGASWSQEAMTRALSDPYPMAVRWRDAQAEAGDHPGLVGGTMAGGCDQMGVFASRFRALPHRRLVVLGPAGSGKTTMAVLLARELLERPEPGDAVPVLLQVSSWDPAREHLHAWVARRLLEDFPALGDADRYGHGAARLLVERGRVLPVLDGLDELVPRRRVAALKAVNRALAAGGPIIVTCRTEEFERVLPEADVVSGAAVVAAVAVPAGAAAAYLRDGISPRRTDAWAPVLAQLDDDPQGPLAIALGLPLNVYLARAVYAAPGTDPAVLARMSDPHAIADHLIDALIPALFATAPEASGGAVQAWEPEQARAWLAFLAAHLTRLGTREFAWWDLARALPGDPASPRPILGAMLGLGLGCVAAGQFESPWAGVVPAVLGAGCGGALSLVSMVSSGSTCGGPRPRPAERLLHGPADRPRSRRSTRLGVLTVFGLGVGAVFEHYFHRGTSSHNQPYELRPALLAGLYAGAVSALVLGLIASTPGATPDARGPARRKGAGRRRGAAAVLRVLRHRLVVCLLVFWTGAALCYALDTTASDSAALGLGTGFGRVSLDAVRHRALTEALPYALIAGLAVAIGHAALGGTGQDRRPTVLDLRPAGRVAALLKAMPTALGRGLLLASLFGLALGVFLVPGIWTGQAAAPWAADRAWRLTAGIAIALVFALVCAPLLGLLRWARRPAQTDLLSPASVLRGERLLTIALILISVLPFLTRQLLDDGFGRDRQTSAALISAAFSTTSTTVFLGLTAGTALAGATSYSTFLLARGYLAATGALPARLMSFLHDAHRLGVLRQVGGTYQFRHARLHDHLAAAAIPAPRPSAEETSRREPAPQDTETPP